MTGQISSSFYGTGRAGESNWTNYSRINTLATLWRDNEFRTLSFHTNLRLKSDLDNNEPFKSQTYVYSLYLKLSGSDRSSIYAGRQFAYNALGSSLIDGIRVSLRIRSTVNLEFFGGAKVAQDSPEKIQSLTGDNIFGGRIEYFASRTSKIALNWEMERSNGDLNRHRLGFEGRTDLRQLELYGLVSYDIIDLNLARSLIRANVRADRWYISTEFDWRKPSVEGNSLFGLIDADTYKDIRMDITRNLNKNIHLLGQFHNEFLTGTDSWRSVIGLRTKFFMIAWHHRDGYGGKSNGIQVYANIYIKPNLEAYGSAFLSRYIIQPETVNKIDAYSSNVGLSYRPGKSTRFNIEGQLLRNAIDKTDFSIFLKIIKGFSFNSSGSGARL